MVPNDSMCGHTTPARRRAGRETRSRRSRSRTAVRPASIVSRSAALRRQSSRTCRHGAAPARLIAMISLISSSPQSQAACLRDESQHLHRLRIVEAIPGSGSSRGRQESDALIHTDAFRLTPAGWPLLRSACRRWTWHHDTGCPLGQGKTADDIVFLLLPTG